MKKFFKKSEKNSAGFTLIELLVVIAIIGLLASVVLIALNGARVKARDAKRVADMKQLQTAIEMYYGDNNGNYPAGCPSNGDLSGLGISSYMSKTPIDPLHQNLLYDYYYCQTCYLASPGPYSCTNGKASEYILGTRLENPANYPQAVVAYGGWGNGSLNFILGSPQ